MLLDKIKENVQHYPEYVIFSDEVHPSGLTNADLWEQSGRIYSYLRQKGIGREDFVMVRLPRSYDFCTAMTGVWRAGAAVVILEDTYAQDRVSYIYQDCGCVFEINKENWNEIMSYPSRDGHEVINEHDAAFAVYTSGSTGKPKGVLHEFGNLEKMIAGMYEKDGSFIIEKDDEVALLIPLNFVAFLIFASGSLFFGQSHSWIVSYSTVKNRKKLAAFFLNKKINFTFLTPSYVRQLGTTGPYLNKLLIGSEPANGIYKKNMKIYNVYAMSESGFPASIFLIDKKYEVCPIGMADEFSLLHILDENGEAADGETGEICFENPFVRGYINLPDQTKKVFVNGMFHTGDLGKVLPDRTIIYLGRNDDMVKIDGNRVEPGEIEAVCKKVLKLKDCVAKAFPNEQTVALYYTDDKEFDTQETSRLLSSYLPYYMIPSHYYRLDEFPKNTFGKVMRKELKLKLKKSEEYAAPRNDFEKKLVEAFKSVLHADDIGIRDDFFELGGTSLNAIELVSILEEENIGAELLYEYRTIEKISDYLSSGKKMQKRNYEPDGFLYGCLKFVSFFISRFIFKRQIKRNEIRDVKTPYVILANHEAALDFFNLIGLTKRRMVPVVSASYYNTMPFPNLVKKLKFIPKQQFQTDIEDIMRMKSVVEGGVPLVLYPAGIQPCDGISTGISYQTWEFLKFLNVDVYAARCEGTYFVKPKWSDAYHPGKTTLDVFKLFSKDELHDLDPEEIGERTLNALEFDAYKDQDKNRWRYKKMNVKGLENVLYICPCCGKEYTIKSKDDHCLECISCGFSQTMDEYGMMHNEKEPGKEIRYASDWSRSVKSALNKKIDSGLKINEPVLLQTIDYEKHKFTDAGKAMLNLNNEFLTLNGTLYNKPFVLELKADSLRGLPVQPGKYFEIQQGKDIYRCRLEDNRKTVQIADLLTLMAERKD